MSQAPQAFQYQAVLRDTSGQVLTETSVTFLFTLLRDSEGDEETLYQEVQATTSSPVGSISLAIGEGAPIEDEFSSIDWAVGPISLRVEIAVDNNSSFVDFGTTELLSVPYALYAPNSSSSWAVLPDSSLNYRNSIVVGDLVQVNPGATIGQVHVVSDEVRHHSGFSSINTNYASREAIRIGQETNQNFLFMCFNNRDYVSFQPSNFTVPNSANLLTDGENGLRFFSRNDDIQFYSGFDLNAPADFTIDIGGGVGIGTDQPKAKLQVNNGDVYIQDATRGVILTSPSGNCFRMMVEDDGSFSSEAISCPE